MDSSTVFKYNPFQHFDANATKNRIIEVTKDNETQIKRILNVSLPLIHMYQPASTIVSVTFTAYDLTMLLGKTACDIKSLQGFAVLSDVAKIGFTTGTLALSILMPAVQAFGSNAYEGTLNLYKCGLSLHAGDFRSAALEFLNAVHHLASVGLVVVGGPELLFVSLLAQAAKELTLSRLEFKQGRILEGVVNLLCAMIRIKSAVPHAQDVYRNHFGKEMTQEDLGRLFLEVIEIQQAQEQSPNATNSDLFDFSILLKKYKLSNKLKKLDMEGYYADKILFKDLQFIETDFRVRITNSKFENVTFRSCNIKETHIFNSSFYKTVFDTCNLSNALFNWSRFNECEFARSNLTRTYFNDTTLIDTGFISSKMSESSFFNAKVISSYFLNSDLKDCLLFDTKDKFQIVGGTPHEITKPVIMLPFDFKSPGAFGEVIDEAIGDSGGISFKIHYKPLVDADLLEKEVKFKLAEYTNDPRNKTHSIAEYILENVKSDSEIGKIKAEVAKAAQYIDGIAIPGGADVQPELYGKKEELYTHPDLNYLRSIFEFAVIDQADKKDIPTLGICRGSQIVNVFFGGTLKQSIDNDHGNRHYLKLKPEALAKETGKIAQEILKGDHIIGLSLHHQASEKIGKGLDVVLDEKGSPELLISEPKNGLYPNFVLTQFHPEVYLVAPYMDYFHNNQNFFFNLIKRAQTRKDVIGAPLT